MRTITILLLLCSLATGLLLADIQTPNRIPIEMKLSTFRALENRSWSPGVEFENAPQDIALTYYDYMPGSYNGSCFAIQPLQAQPYGSDADGLYLAYMYQENSTSQRRIYYTYISAAGEMNPHSAISPNSVREGFVTVDIDPVTANPVLIWHSDVDGDGLVEGMFSYDLYNLVGGPGLWHQPEPIINNPIPEFDPYEEFLWPVLRIGPSPEAGKRRIHIYANNDPPVGNAEYNIIYGYADVEYDEATFTMDVSPWNWRTFPMLDHWQDEQIKRAIKDMAVSREDGQVALIGHAADSLWIYYSSDYGVNFAYKSQNAHYPVYNPWNIDPITLEPSEPFFLNNDGSEAELFLETNGDGGHYNVIFTDNNTKIVFMSAMGLNTVESAANNQYYPAHFHPKIFVYNVLTEEFDFIDLQITGVDPYDNQPMIPFDLDEDGIVDNHDENGNVEFVDCWPTYYFNGDSQTGSFHESLFKIASNEEMGWCVALFQDGRNLQNAYYEVPGYEEWSEVAEIAITASTDHGIHWSAPSYMNALASDVNYYPELANMLPAYVYINDEIEYVAENLGRLHLFFLDDNSYGSFATSNAGQNNGGTMMYATLLIDFSPANDTDDNTVIASSGLSQNYPNPFNPSTTIPYYMREQGEVKLEVYNIKGQFIRTLVSGYRDAGVHSVIWDGTDEKDRAVPSGIYFYRMRTKQETETKKMILMK